MRCQTLLIIIVAISLSCLLATTTAVLGAASHKQTFTINGASGARKAMFVDGPRKKLYVGSGSKIYTLATANSTCPFPCLSWPTTTGKDPISSTTMTGTNFQFTNALKMSGKRKDGSNYDRGFFFGTVAPARFLALNVYQSPAVIDSEFANETLTGYHFRAAARFKQLLFVFTYPADATATLPTHVTVFKAALEKASVAWHALNIEFHTLSTVQKVAGVVASPPPKGSTDPPPLLYLWSEKSGKIWKYDMLDRKLLGAAAVSVAGDGISALNTVAVSVPTHDTGGQLDEWIFASGTANGIFVVRWSNEDESARATPDKLEPTPIEAKSKQVYKLHVGTPHEMVDSIYKNGFVFFLDKEVRLQQYSTSTHKIELNVGTTHGRKDLGETTYSSMAEDSDGTLYVLQDSTPVRVAVFSGVVGEFKSGDGDGTSGPDGTTIVAIVVVCILAVCMIFCLFWAYKTNQEAEKTNEQFEASPENRDDRDIHRVAAGGDDDDDGGGSHASHAIRRLDTVDSDAVAPGPRPVVPPPVHGGFTDISRLGNDDDDYEMGNVSSPPKDM